MTTLMLQWIVYVLLPYSQLGSSMSRERKAKYVTTKGCVLCGWEICLQHVSVERVRLQVIHIPKLLRRVTWS